MRGRSSGKTAPPVPGLTLTRVVGGAGAKKKVRKKVIGVNWHLSCQFSSLFTRPDFSTHVNSWRLYIIYDSRDQLRVEGHALARLERIDHRQLGRGQLEAGLERRPQVLALPCRRGGVRQLVRVRGRGRVGVRVRMGVRARARVGVGVRLRARVRARLGQGLGLDGACSTGSTPRCTAHRSATCAGVAPRASPSTRRVGCASSAGAPGPGHGYG